MVRGFSYRGETFRATVHGRPGKEEIFIVHINEDDEEGAEISLDRFEDPKNDPAQALDLKLVELVDQLMVEVSMQPSDPNGAFTWLEANTDTKVHSGVQH